MDSTTSPAARKPEQRKWLVVLIVVFMILGASAWRLHRYFVDTGLLEMPFDRAIALQAVQQIISNTLLPNSDGIVKLPPALAKAAVDGEVYVYTDSSGTTWILFRTWRGKGCNLRGMAYRSTSSSGPAPATVKVKTWVPANSPAGPWTTLIDLNVEQQIDPNWYQVYWDLD